MRRWLKSALQVEDCTRHAHAMHMPCTCHAHAMHMPCTCHAHIHIHTHMLLQVEDWQPCSAASGVGHAHTLAQVSE